MTGTGVPLFAPTWYRLGLSPRLNTIVSFVPHVPTLHGPNGASQIVRAAPPSTGIRFIFPAAKKPSERLSGDQKGFEAPSVPATSRSSVEPRGRRKSCCAMDVVTSMTSIEPSGEIADETPKIS